MFGNVVYIFSPGPESNQIFMHKPNVPERVQNGVSFPFIVASIKSLEPQNSLLLSKYPIMTIKAKMGNECT